MIDTMTFMRRDIVIMAFAFAPTHMIMIGPNATFGKEFSMVKKGSITFARNFQLYMRTLMINAIPIPKEKAMSISSKVTQV